MKPETRLTTVKLPNGTQLDIEYTAALVEEVREKYNLGPADEVVETLIQLYLTEELRSALSKVKEKDAT